jgi:hypothetical protein
MQFSVLSFQPPQKAASNQAAPPRICHIDDETAQWSEIRRSIAQRNLGVSDSGRVDNGDGTITTAEGNYFGSVNNAVCGVYYPTAATGGGSGGSAPGGCRIARFTTFDLFAKYTGIKIGRSPHLCKICSIVCCRLTPTHTAA